MNKSLLGICLLFIIATQSIGQQVHFVFLQTENRQPFYITMAKKNYSSSSIGYMILPKLENGEYDIRIGFPKSEEPEQSYVLKVNDNEQGYLVKQFGEKGWGLFNLQSLAVQYSGSVTSQKSILAAAEKVREKERADSLAAVESLAMQKRMADSIAAVNQKLAEEKALIAAAAQEKLAEEKRISDSLNLAKLQLENQKTSATEAAKAKLAAEKQSKDSLAQAKQKLLDDKKANAAAAAQAKTAEQKRRTDSLAQVKKALADKKTQELLAAKEKVANQKKPVVTVATTTRTKAAAEKKTADSLAAVKRILDEQALAEAAAQVKQAAEKKTADSLALVIKTTNDQAEMAAQARIAAEKKRMDSLALAKKSAEEKVKLPTENTGIDTMAFIKNIETKTIPSYQNGTVIVPNSPGTTIALAPTLISQIKTDSGYIYQYTLSTNGRLDTISAFIKSEPIMATSFVRNNTANDSANKKDVSFLNIDFKQDSINHASETIVPVFSKVDTNANIQLNPPKVEEKKPVVTITDVVVKTKDSVPAVNNGALPSNSNCSMLADEKDFFALRKKMIGQEGTDEMVLVARKSMKEKCYTTDQIRNLAVLFLTDSDRYQFLDAAYPFAYDANKYGSLIDILKDAYYVDRFKAMIRK